MLEKGSHIWLVSSDGRHSSGICFSLIKLRRKTKEMYWNSAKFIFSTLTVLHKCGVTAEMTCDFGFQWTNPFHPHRAGPPPSVVARYQRYPAMFHDFPHENSQPVFEWEKNMFKPTLSWLCHTISLSKGGTSHLFLIHRSPVYTDHSIKKMVPTKKTK